MPTKQITKQVVFMRLSSAVFAFIGSKVLVTSPYAMETRGSRAPATKALNIPRDMSSLSFL